MLACRRSVQMYILPAWFWTPFRQYIQTTGTVFQEDLKTSGDDLVSLPCDILHWVLRCVLQSSATAFPCKNVRILQHTCMTSSKAAHEKLQSLILCIGTTHCRVLSQLPGGALSSGRMQMNKWLGSLCRKEGTKLYKVSSAGYQVSRKQQRTLWLHAP